MELKRKLKHLVTILLIVVTIAAPSINAYSTENTGMGAVVAESKEGIRTSSSSNLSKPDAAAGTPLDAGQNPFSVTAVTDLLVALPSVEVVEAFVPVLEVAEDDEDYEQLYTLALQEYHGEVQGQVWEARQAYDSLDDLDQSGINSDLIERLTVLETYFLLDVLRTPRSGPTQIGDGNYTYNAQTAASAFPLVISGNPTITLEDVDFNASAVGGPAIDIMDDSNVVLIIKGTNELRGGAANGEDCAAIRVADGASLTIEGGVNDELKAYGGDGYNGGAGIGSNGMDDCGKIIINGGVITATGGRPLVLHSGGGGAGIGNGGTHAADWEFIGAITITNGTVEAVGNNNSGNYDSLAGAGIGSGGINSGFKPTSNNLMGITIKGGNISATGIDDAAGIGGGGNANSGTIIISGGSIDARANKGGAAIGGSYNRYADNILISGGVIKATSYYGGAGIGGGYGGGVKGGIVINGDADVTAKGGALISGAAGGRWIGSAGIGTGVGMNIYHGADIRIDGQAKIRAYSGGYGANAIGWGTPYSRNQNVKNVEEEMATSIHIGKDVDLLAIVEDKITNAIPLQSLEFIETTYGGTIPIETFIEAPAELVYYTIEDPDVSPYPSANTEVDTNPSFQTPTGGGGNIYKWQYAGKELKITEVGDYEYVSQIPGNWAVIHYQEPPKVTVTYEWGINQEVPPRVSTPSNVVLSPGETFTTSSVDEPDGYIFHGWFTDPECTIPYTDNKTYVDLTLYGKWTRRSTEDKMVTVTFEWGTNQEAPPGVNPPPSLTVKPGEIFSVPQLADEGEYEFGGWFTDPECTVPWTANKTAVDITLYGKWTRAEVPDTGNLTVSKRVSGGGASTTRAFTFTVTLSDRSLNGIYGQMTFENGVAVFTLRHGERITAKGLMAGLTYTVTESNNSGYQVTASGSSGTIPADGNALAAFENYRGGGSNGGNGGSGGGNGGSGSGADPGVIPDPGGVVPPTPGEVVPPAPGEEPTVPDIPTGGSLPKTGDEFNLAIPYLILSLAAVLLVSRLKRRRTDSD